MISITVSYKSIYTNYLYSVYERAKLLDTLHIYDGNTSDYQSLHASRRALT